MQQLLPNTLSSASAQPGLAALFAGSLIVPLAATGWIRATGEDRVRWLNGMVTNSIQALTTGAGCFNFLLNAQGRIQGSAWAFAEPDALLLETDRGQVAPLMDLLDRFIIMDDVELADMSDERAGILVAGPDAPAALHQIGLPNSSPGPAAHLVTTMWQGTRLEVVSKPGRLFPTWELWIEPSLVADLSAALEQTGAVPSDPMLLEWIRLLKGLPRFGVDIRERELPQETGQTEALHFSKGCYVGQEIVERIRSRGNVHRTFHGFRVDGPLPPPGAALEAGGKPVGELTSVAQLPALPGYPDGLPLALGYIRREVLDGDLPITYLGGRVYPLSLPGSLTHAMHPTPEGY